ncbi:MAG TPA: UvrD-helicase domain-containing protein [Candidatus Sulfotelmatobacter sp.]|nr:UvrD-helicase domain-containing protein [Candidatus Sulfotelmatobacter sp.]
MKTSLKLDKFQKLAINHAKGPLLIIAGAGTGKTTVITERIRNLIIKKRVNPSKILALTFTDKASFEMQERVDVLLPYGYTNLWIQTFHSFCERILRDEAHNIGLDPNYKLISEAESVLLLRQNIFDLGLNIFRPLGNPNKFLESLLIHFSRLKDEDISPKEYLLWAKSQKKSKEYKEYMELANSYSLYEKLKIKTSVMDFSDLISNTLLLFRNRSNVLKRYQKQFEYILVDEFQDTNFAQNELAMLLSGDDKNITVVADDDQSIYRFRGAAISNVLQFKKNFPKAKIITLINNYRSTQEILDTAYRLIQYNNPNRLEVVEKINKKLISSVKKQGEKIELIHEIRPEDESEKIAQIIKNLIKEKYDYKDIAILVRANNHAQGITTALQRNRIPYQFLGPGYLFQQEEIKDLIAYLAFLTNLSDSVSLFRVLSMEIFEISYIELNFLLNFAKKRNISLFEALSNLNQAFLTPPTIKKLEKFRKMVEEHLKKARSEQAGQILYDFLVKTGIYQTLNITNSTKEEKKVLNIAKFFDRVKNFETERTDANIFTLSDWLMLMMQMGDSPLAAEIDLRDNNAVNILTLHSSKGLEFPIVFIVNLVSDRFPTRERSEKIPLPAGIIKEKLPKDSDFHLEEERRLFYVGITRAKDKLYFTASDYYGNGIRPKKLSPFIFESLPYLNKNQTSKKASEQLSLTSILSSYKEAGEKPDKKMPIKISYITYSNLQMFDICPLHYKAKVILNLPTPPQAIQSFGISLHKTLYDFYKLVNEGKNPTLKEFIKILKNDWESFGYDNKKHEKERFIQAEKIIKNFFKTECNPSVKPLGIEQPFSFTLKNGVKVFGKIDRIDKKEKGIEIIDYKTGLDNPKADLAHQFQLAIYALAATKVNDSNLNRKPEDITLTIHFLEKNTKKSMSFNKKDLEKLENELISKIEEIEKSDFKCSRNILCKNCEFKMLCSTFG